MRHFYTVEFKLKALVALSKNNNNIYETAKQLGISRQTLNNWSRDRDKLYALSEKLAEEDRLPLYRRLNLLINQISDALPEMVASARLGDATRALTTLISLSESLEASYKAREERTSDVRAKLERLLERYAANQEAEISASASLTAQDPVSLT